ncbi:MAG: rod shape-determining protein MreC [Gammaproteobacteria bacterium]
MLFTQGPSLTARLVTFVVASILLMTADQRLHQFERLRGGLSAALYPLQYLINLPTAGWHSLNESLATRLTLLRENTQLHDENLHIKARLLRYEALQAENKRLKELLDSSVKLEGHILVAELLSVDLDPSKQQILINKGSQQKVFEGQPLLDATGIVGQVLHVAPFSSTAILITDPDHALPVQVNRNGLRTIAVGTGDLHRLNLPHVPNNADIKVGDLLITSGLGGRFPADYPVATVTVVAANPGSPFAKVTAVPTAHLDRSREVLLVWPEPTDTPDTFVGPPRPAQVKP